MPEKKKIKHFLDNTILTREPENHLRYKRKYELSETVITYPCGEASLSKVF